jgi:putative membrane protein
MKNMKKLSLATLLLFSVGMFQACTNQSNQDSVENAQDTNEAKIDSAAISGSVDEDAADFVVKAASGGMMEVLLGKLAEQKAVNPRVKSFGSMMVTDHTKANDELKSIAATKNITLPETLGEDHQKHVDELGQKSGKEFDKAYMSLMADDHKEDVDMFEEASRDVMDADIKAFASKTLPVLRIHLDSAKAINDVVKK